MQTGLVIEAEVTDKGLNHFCVKRVYVKGEDWVKNKYNVPNIEDATDWVNLMVEGIATVIMSNHDSKMKDSAEFLRETIAKLEKAVYMASDTSSNMAPDNKDYSADFDNPDRIISNGKQ